MKKYLIPIILIIIAICIVSFIIGKNFINIDNKVVIKDEQAINTNETKKYNTSRQNAISQYIPKNIYKISIINYFSDLENPNTKIIEDLGEVEKIVNLLFATSWEIMNENHVSSNFDDAFCRVIITGDTDMTLNLQGFGGSNSMYGIIKLGDKHYYIDKNIYQEIVNYGVEKYYLHDSNLEVPNQEKCYEAQKQALQDLTESEKMTIQENMRSAHWIMEYKLVSAVNSLKDSNSPYWGFYTNYGVFTDPFTGTKIEDRQNFLLVYDTLMKVIDNIKDNETKQDLENAANTLKEGMDEHNLSKCFEAHKTIHDYDYFVINTPVHLETPPADWGGVTTYFGTPRMLV